MTPKEVWIFLGKMIEAADDHKMSNFDILQIIGLLKIAQTSMMLRMDSHNPPFEEKQKEK